ncbi:DUF2332 domain-containing protein [Erythrobacter sp. LQ02-29]|uniref:DUF2332 domain-containing protein n=1 Tax=Erythrobacter sp. LQ02-29 TaxID=2920384 RepID=UPI001F4D50AC|nr:DUF2332 domain-containing protein [Erythrobacter sp. LQ02-29]MCP9223790.1 DUF2332 domain-containing protein [Erythrobacter sp. LQ02-29]
MAEKQAVMEIASVREAIEWQARHAEEAGMPNTARVIRGLLPVVDGDTTVGLRLANWHGLTLRDAMPLRIHGGLHHLLLTGEDKRLEPVYAGLTTDQGQVDDIVVALVEKYDHQLLAWLDGPPQTNEAGRSASLLAGLLWLGQRVPPRFELLEIGASAGINTMMHRFRFDLGGVLRGPPDSPVQLTPEWRGDPPPETNIQIASIRGCDTAPIDLADPVEALRLKSYVWPEARGRMQRVDAAARLAQESPPEVVRMDAMEFVRSALAQPQEEGTTRVLFHSIVWQYLPDFQQEAIENAMAEAGAAASETRALAWLTLETNRETFRHELHARYWPGGEEPVLLGHAHPHGEWVEWLGVG